MSDKPFELSIEEQTAVRRILDEIERRGYDDIKLDPVLGALKGRLWVRYTQRQAPPPESREYRRD